MVQILFAPSASYSTTQRSTGSTYCHEPKGNKTWSSQKAHKALQEMVMHKTRRKRSGQSRRQGNRKTKKQGVLRVLPPIPSEETLQSGDTTISIP